MLDFMELPESEKRLADYNNTNRQACAKFS